MLVILSLCRFDLGNAQRCERDSVIDSRRIVNVARGGIQVLEHFIPRLGGVLRLEYFDSARLSVVHKEPAVFDDWIEYLHGHALSFLVKILQSARRVGSALLAGRDDQDGLPISLTIRFHGIRRGRILLEFGPLLMVPVHERCTSMDDIGCHRFSLS